MDLEKFFDKVNPDVLMSRLARRIGDKPLLKLIRLYLQSGIMQNGIVTVRERKFRKSLKEVFRRGRGRKITDTIEELNPKLREWFNYFQYAENKGMMEETDGWLRTRFRCIIWRQWKSRHRRRIELMNRGIEPERTKVSADNGFGPWHNASASHMKQAFPKRFFDIFGLISLFDMKKNRQFKLETAVYGTVRTVV